MSAQLSPGLHCNLNWGLKLKSNTRIKRRLKHKSSQISCVSEKHKSSCARKVMEQTVGSEGVQTQPGNGLTNLSTAQAQWVRAAHSWFSTLFQCCLTHFASSWLWVRGTEGAPYSSLFNLSGQSLWWVNGLSLCNQHLSYTAEHLPAGYPDREQDNTKTSDIRFRGFPGYCQLSCHYLTRTSCALYNSKTVNSGRFLWKELALMLSQAAGSQWNEECYFHAQL